MLRLPPAEIGQRDLRKVVAGTPELPVLWPWRMKMARMGLRYQAAGAGSTRAGAARAGFGRLEDDGAVHARWKIKA